MFRKKNCYNVTLFSKNRQEEKLLPDFNAIFSEAASGFSVSALNVTNVIRVAFIIVFGVTIIRILSSIVARALDHSPAMGAIKGYINSVVKVGMWFVLVLMVADAMGIPTTSLIALMSVAGVAVSLALQNTLANLAGGIMLLVTKPIEVGDFVEADGVSGTVEAIGLAYSTLITGDNKQIFIPNSQISAAKIVNYTRLGKRRLDLTFSASYDAPTQTVKTAIREVLEQFPQIHQDPAPAIWLSNYGASSIDYLVRVWVNSGDYWDVNFGIMEGVREAFDKHGIEMTYDHLNVHVLEK